MPDLTKNSDLYPRGDKRPVRAGDCDTETVKSGTTVTIFSKQVPDDKIGWFGHGPYERSVAEAFIYFNAVASGNGSGNDGDAITGTLEARIMDSEQRRILADVTIDELSQLADAESDERTERPVMAALAPFAKPGRYLEFVIRADSTSDGHEFDPVDSTGVLYYTFA
jgi:hypothetical protein